MRSDAGGQNAWIIDQDDDRALGIEKTGPIDEASSILDSCSAPHFYSGLPPGLDDVGWP